jgi:hypothetical protein
MLRKGFASLGVAVMGAGMFLAGSVTPATASPMVNGHGTVLCGISTGGGNVSPGLSVIGSAGGVKINFHAKFSTGNCNSNVTSPAGVVVIGGRLTGSGFYNGPVAGGNGSSCANFDGPDVVGKITVVIHWTTTGGPIAPTTVNYKLNTATVSGTLTDTITLKAPTGTAHKTGSFITPPTVGPNMTQLVTTLPAPATCTATPVTTFTISGGVVNM